MKFADKYNKSFAQFTFKPADGTEYRSLKEMYNGENGDNIYPVKGMYINRKSKFGDSPVIVSDEYFINLPKHLLENVQEMLKDNELIEAINANKFGCEVYEYETNGKTCYSVNWVDM